MRISRKKVGCTGQIMGSCRWARNGDARRSQRIDPSKVELERMWCARGRVRERSVRELRNGSQTACDGFAIVRIRARIRA